MGGPGCASTQIQADTTKITYAENEEPQARFCPAHCRIQLPAFQNDVRGTDFSLCADIS